MFNAYIQGTMKKFRDSVDVATKIQGRKVDMLRYEDDVVMQAEEE